MGPIVYVSDLPVCTREQLRLQLDSDQSWRKIATQILTKQTDIQSLQQVEMQYKGSPSDELFKMMCNRCVTVEVLFYKLFDADFMELCKNLKPFVKPELQKMIKTYGYDEPQGKLLPVASEIHDDEDDFPDEEPPDEHTIKHTEPPRPRSPRQMAAPPVVAPCRTPPAKERPAAEPAHNPISVLPRVSYADIFDATNKFSSDCLIGSGTFTEVYRVSLQGTVYAVKRFIRQDEEQAERRKQAILAELQTIARFQHENILRLFFICFECDACMVYQYMPHGSLEDRLAGKNDMPPLTMRARLGILMGAARGLNYLHRQDPPQLHGDIRCAQVLLDSHDKAYLSDFKLSRAADQPSQQSSLRGKRTHVKLGAQTQGALHHAYVAPEVSQGGKLSTKSEVYSFGLMIASVATGQKVYDERRPDTKYLYELFEVAFGELEGDELRRHLWHIRDRRCIDWCPEPYNVLVTLAHSCLGKKPRRPDIQTVLHALEEIDALAQTSAPASADPYSTFNSIGQLSQLTDLETPAVESTGLNWPSCSPPSYSDMLLEIPEQRRSQLSPLELQSLHDQIHGGHVRDREDMLRSIDLTLSQRDPLPSRRTPTHDAFDSKFDSYDASKLADEQPEDSGKLSTDYSGCSEDDGLGKPRSSSKCSDEALGITEEDRRMAREKAEVLEREEEEAQAEVSADDVSCSMSKLDVRKDEAMGDNSLYSMRTKPQRGKHMTALIRQPEVEWSDGEVEVSGVMNITEPEQIPVQSVPSDLPLVPSEDDLHQMHSFDFTEAFEAYMEAHPEDEDGEEREGDGEAESPRHFPGENQLSGPCPPSVRLDSNVLPSNVPEEMAQVPPGTGQVTAGADEYCQSAPLDVMPSLTSMDDIYGPSPSYQPPVMRRGLSEEDNVSLESRDSNRSSAPSSIPSELLKKYADRKILAALEEIANENQYRNIEELKALLREKGYGDYLAD